MILAVVLAKMSKPCAGCKQPSNPQPIPRVISVETFERPVLEVLKNVLDLLERNKLDSVTALLVLRRDIGVIAGQLDECWICAKDLQMSVQFDSLMIQAKTTRETYKHSKWRAIKMFLAFEKNVLRAAIRWTLGI